MSKIRSLGSSLSRSWILWPLLAALASLIPRIGRFKVGLGVGLGPEWFLHRIRGYEVFAANAADVRWAMVAVFAVAGAAALAWWLAAVQQWGARLQTFDVSRVAHYRAFVWWRALGAFASASAAAAAAVVASPALQAGGLPSGVIFGTVSGLVGLLQFLALIRGVPRTLRLHRGY